MQGRVFFPESRLESHHHLSVREMFLLRGQNADKGLGDAGLGVQGLGLKDAHIRVGGRDGTPQSRVCASRDACIGGVEHRQRILAVEI